MTMITCQECGVQFEFYSSRAERRKFCGYACRRKHYRRCRHCGSEKVKTASGSHCRKCSAAAARKYHNDHREERIAATKRWRVNNRERLTAYRQRYRAEHLP